MLRFESTELITELVTELEVRPNSASNNDSTAQSAAIVAISACPIWAKKMLPFADASGFWECMNVQQSTRENE